MCKSHLQYRNIHSQVRAAFRHDAECRKNGVDWDYKIINPLLSAPLHIVQTILDYRHPSREFRKNPIGQWDKMFGPKPYHGPKGKLPA